MHFVWEDKALDISLDNFKYQGQIMAEVKAMSTYLQQCFGAFPELFCGILTNGIDLSIAQMRNCEIQRFRLSDTCDGRLCHRLLVHSICTSRDIAHFIDMNTSSVSEQTKLKRGASDFDQDDEEDLDRDDSDDSQPPPPKRRSVLSTTYNVGAACAGDSSSSSAAPSGANPTKRSSGVRNSHRSALSIENVALHDVINNSSFRCGISV